MINQSPITPPPQLVEKWNNLPLPTQDIIAIAWQHGADQELKACCEWLDVPNNRSDRGDGWLMPGRLRAARRPKSQSLKKQALEELEQLRGEANSMGMRFDAPAIRRALEQLPDKQ